MSRIPTLAILFCAPLVAQEPLSLKDAVRLALTNNQSVAAADANQQEAAAKVSEARSSFLPKVDYAESWTRSDNPVFVFSSLLTQRQFSAGNFQLGPLNRPDFLNNFASRVTADQPLYDAGKTRRAVQSQQFGQDITKEDGRRVRMEVIAGVLRFYCDALLGAEQVNLTEQALRSARADLERTEARLAAGMTTDSDVLSIRVHVAGVREQQIARTAEFDVARAALNDAIGLPLGAPHQLTTSLKPVAIAAATAEQYEAGSAADRPESRQVKLATKLAESGVAVAHSNYLPEVGLHAVFEADRQNFYNRGGANWLVSAELRWNLFNGFGDKARTEASKSALQRAKADELRTDSAIRLQVMRALADLRAAGQRIEVATATVAEAGESLRITQNRYDAGLATVTDLLRTETAVMESSTRRLAAIHDQRIAAGMLELAAGSLNPDSEVLK
jgi:outer membrane protein